MLNFRLGISNDFYVRTTSKAHMARCQAFWTQALEKGDVYLGTYEGWCAWGGRGGHAWWGCVCVCVCCGNQWAPASCAVAIPWGEDAGHARGRCDCCRGAEDETFPLDCSRVLFQDVHLSTPGVLPVKRRDCLSPPRQIQCLAMRISPPPPPQVQRARGDVCDGDGGGSDRLPRPLLRPPPQEGAGGVVPLSALQLPPGHRGAHPPMPAVCSARDQTQRGARMGAKVGC